MVVLKVNSFLASFSLERRRERERPVGELELGVACCHLPPREQQPLIHYSKVA